MQLQKEMQIRSKSPFLLPTAEAPKSKLVIPNRVQTGVKGHWFKVCISLQEVRTPPYNHRFPETSFMFLIISVSKSLINISRIIFLQTTGCFDFFFFCLFGGNTRLCSGLIPRSVLSKWMKPGLATCKAGTLTRVISIWPHIQGYLTQISKCF